MTSFKSATHKTELNTSNLSQSSETVQCIQENIAWNFKPTYTGKPPTEKETDVCVIMTLSSVHHAIRMPHSPDGY